MKILHCIYDHTCNPWVGGGGAVRVHEIYRRIAARHEITVLCGKYPGAKDYHEGEMRYRFVGTPRNNYVASTFCYTARAAGYVRSSAKAYNVVVEDFAPYNPIFSFLPRKDAVIQLHQREGLLHVRKYALLGIPFFLIEKYYPRFFMNAVTISEGSKEKYGLAGEVAVIPNGFDRELLDHEASEADYVLFLGRLHIGQKGLDTLRDAVDLVRCRLIIAGGGKDEVRVRSLFSRAVASGVVSFIGVVKDRGKEELLSNCLFMVAPSRYEGHPLTVMEAAACGKPVIVSDIPELRFAIDAGFGISFRVDDAEDLAEKIGLLMGDPFLRREMGMKAREYAKEFSWDQMAEEYEKFLCAVAEGTRETGK